MDPSDVGQLLINEGVNRVHKVGSADGGWLVETAGDYLWSSFPAHGRRTFMCRTSRTVSTFRSTWAASSSRSTWRSWRFPTGALIAESEWALSEVQT